MEDFTTKRVFNKGVMSETYLINGREVSESTFYSLIDEKFSQIDKITGNTSKKQLPQDNTESYDEDDCDCDEHCDMDCECDCHDLESECSCEDEVCPRCQTIHDILAELAECECFEERFEILGDILDGLLNEAYDDGVIQGLQNGAQILSQVGMAIDQGMFEEE